MQQQKSQLMDVMIRMGDCHRHCPELRSAVNDLAWAYVYLNSKEGQDVDVVKAVQRTDEAMTQLHCLAGMLRDRDPARADHIHLWIRSLAKLKDELMNELDEMEGDYAQIQDCRTVACCDG
jgi:hypothetical protein